MEWIGMLMISPLATPLAGCGSAHDPSTMGGEAPLPTDLTTLASAVDDDIQGLLLSAQPLRVGPNQVFYRFSHKSDGQPISSAAVTQTPVMGMSGAAPVHACPVSNPRKAADENTLFAGKIYFTMPAATGGTWLDQVRVVPDGSAAAYNLVFQGFTVAPSDAVTTFTDGTSNYVVTLTLAGGAVRAGDNEFTLALHATRPDGAYAPVNDAGIAIMTTMAAMGHGSSGNRDPVFRADGEYDGSFNLSMAGQWAVMFHVTRYGREVGAVEYELTI